MCLVNLFFTSSDSAFPHGGEAPAPHVRRSSMGQNRTAARFENGNIPDFANLSTIYVQVQERLLVRRLFRPIRHINVNLSPPVISFRIQEMFSPPWLFFWH